MKRILAVYISLLLLMGTFAVLPINAEEAENVTEEKITNLFFNGNLESTREAGKELVLKGPNFSILGAPIVKLGTEYGKTGNGIRVDATEAYQRNMIETNTEMADFRPGDMLNLTWNLRSNTQTRYQLMLCASNMDGSRIENTGTWADNPSNGMLYINATGEKWEKQSYTFKVPEGCTYVKFVFFTMQNDGAAYADFDDFCLEYIDAANGFTNGGLESFTYNETAKKDMPDGCILPGMESYARNYTLAKEYAYDGERGIRLSYDNKTGIQRAVAFEALKSTMEFNDGDTLPLSYFVRSNCETSYKISFTNAGGEEVAPEIMEKLASTKEEWKEISREVTVPQGCEVIRFETRNYSTANGNYADFDSFYLGNRDAAEGRFLTYSEEAADAAAKKAYEREEPYPGAENLIKDGSFENSLDMENWKYFYEREYYTVTNEMSYEGDVSLRIDSPSDKWPIAYQIITDGLVGGATYYFSAMGRTLSNRCGSRFTFEYVDVPVSEYSSAAIKEAGGKGLGSDFCTLTFQGPEWQHVSTRITIPEDCKTVVVNLRNFMNDTNLFLDDVRFYMIEPPALFDIDTDQVFYYSDYAEDGVAELKLTDLYAPVGGETVSIALYDGETVIKSAENLVVTAENPAIFTYPMQLLSEKQKAYTLKAELRDKDGNVLNAQEQNVYRYDRPTHLTEDGRLIFDGEIFNIHAALSNNSSANFEKAAEMGLNTICVYMGQLEGAIAELEKYNLKAMVPLYGSMKPAGHPDNAAATRAVVERFKDSPAVLGWQLMDEPNMNIPAADFEWQMEASYKVVRDADPNHPCIIVDAIEDADPDVAREKCERWAKYTDLLLDDSYTAYYGADCVGTYVEEQLAKSVPAPRGNRPVHYVAGTFERNDFFPSLNEHRNSMWQSFMMGSRGFEIYPFISVFHQGGTNQRDGNLPDAPIFPELVKWSKTGELEMAYDHFVNYTTQYINGGREETHWWELFEKDGSVYLVIVNKKNAEQTVSIPLESHDGKAKITAASAELIGGTMVGTKTTVGDALTHNLTPNEVAYYKLTPTPKMDFSVVQDISFRDMDGHVWARSAVEKLREEGILRLEMWENYRPQDMVTRGDFAMMLVRALGIEETEKEGFGDVHAEAYYAKELARGKAAGIIEGVGDNRFNAVGFVTRQDIMTMTSRALTKLSKVSEEKADLSAFSDASGVADYAKEHVEKMVSAGIITGNADGTLNPTGNTTRAEAAVIIDRILSLVK